MLTDLLTVEKAYNDLLSLSLSSRRTAVDRLQQWHNQHTQPQYHHFVSTQRQMSNSQPSLVNMVNGAADDLGVSVR
jgi:hypothetical protein